MSGTVRGWKGEAGGLARREGKTGGLEVANVSPQYSPAAGRTLGHPALLNCFGPLH